MSISSPSIEIFPLYISGVIQLNSDISIQSGSSWGIFTVRPVEESDVLESDKRRVTSWLSGVDRKVRSPIFQISRVRFGYWTSSSESFSNLVTETDKGALGSMGSGEAENDLKVICQAVGGEGLRHTISERSSKGPFFVGSDPPEFVGVCSARAGRFGANKSAVTAQAALTEYLRRKRGVVF